MDKYALVILLLGALFLFMSTVFRFLFQPDYKNNIMKSIIKSLLPVDLRRKNIQSFGLLFQLPGLFWIVFGKAYSDIVLIYEISNMQRNLLSILMGIGPPFISWGLLNILRYTYWQKNDNQTESQ
jgi:hypothetical protein